MKFFTFVIAAMIYMVSAATDYCMVGSDTLCQKYGSDYCCALIDVTKDGFREQYHACASRTGIEYLRGKFSGGGYSGTWRCDSAFNALSHKLGSMLTVALVAVLASAQ